MSILLKSFAGDECGATAIEYALIASLIAVFGDVPLAVEIVEAVVAH